MGHVLLLSMLRFGVDAINSHRRILLAMALFPTVPLTPFVLKDNNLLGFALLDNLPVDGGIIQHRLADTDILPVRHHQDPIKGHRISHISGDFLYPQDFAFLDFILFTSGTDNCVHIPTPSTKV